MYDDIYIIIYVYNIYIYIHLFDSMCIPIIRHSPLSYRSTQFARPSTPRANEAERFGFNPHQPQWSLLSFQLSGIVGYPEILRNFGLITLNPDPAHISKL